MVDRLSSLSDITEDFFKHTYPSYQTTPQPEPRFSYPPSLRTKQDCIDVNQFLLELQSHVFEPQCGIDFIPSYPNNNGKALYPTLALGYSQPDLTPSTNLYPHIFDQNPLPSTTFMGMGTRMPADQSRLVYSGTLQKAPPRSGSEELVDDMEKMDVDSESKEKKEEVKKEEQPSNKDLQAKHLETIKRLQKFVQELLERHEKEDRKAEQSKEVMEVTA
jgi:hypothetical protein